MTRPPRHTVTPFSRDYRRPPRWHLGPPSKPPRGPVRWWHRIADPRFYLRAVIVICGLALVAMPMVADGTLAALRPIAIADGTCRVLHVVDGDTADIWCPATGMERARLAGFDAPELFSPNCFAELVAAQKAKWALRVMLFTEADLQMQRRGQDQYGRRLVTLWVGPDLLSKRMIASGHGREYGGGKRGTWC